MTQSRTSQQCLKGCRPSRPQTWLYAPPSLRPRLLPQRLPDARLRPPASVLTEHRPTLLAQSFAAPSADLPLRSFVATGQHRYRAAPLQSLPGRRPTADTAVSGSPLVAIPLPSSTAPFTASHRLGLHSLRAAPAPIRVSRDLLRHLPRHPNQRLRFPRSGRSADPSPCASVPVSAPAVRSIAPRAHLRVGDCSSL